MEELEGLNARLHRVSDADWTLLHVESSKGLTQECLDYQFDEKKN